MLDTTKSKKNSGYWPYVFLCQFKKKILFILLYLKIHIYLIGRHHKFHSSLSHYLKVHHKETICIVQNYKEYPKLEHSWKPPSRSRYTWIQGFPWNHKSWITGFNPCLSNHVCLLSHFENKKPFHCT